MEWFNVFGLIFLVVIMIPNIVFAIKCKDGFNNKWNVTIQNHPYSKMKLG